MALLLFVSCNSYQKQLNRFHAFALQHTNELAKVCADVFPAKDSIGEVTTIVKPANNKDQTEEVKALKSEADSLQSVIDAAAKDKSNPCSEVISDYQAKIKTLNARITSLAASYQKCKPDTIFKTNNIYRVDEAALRVCQNHNDVQRDSLVSLRTTLKATQETASDRQRTIWILIGILAVGIAGAILKLTGRI